MAKRVGKQSLHVEIRLSAGYPGESHPEIIMAQPGNRSGNCSEKQTENCTKGLLAARGQLGPLSSFSPLGVLWQSLHT